MLGGLPIALLLRSLRLPVALLGLLRLSVALLLRLSVALLRLLRLPIALLGSLRLPVALLRRLPVPGLLPIALLLGLLRLPVARLLLLRIALLLGIPWLAVRIAGGAIAGGLVHSWRVAPNQQVGASEPARSERIGGTTRRVPLLPIAPESPPPLLPRAAGPSVTTMTELVLPTHANSLGSVFGGQVLAWIDLCGAICAQRYTGSIVVTAGIDDLSFDGPVKVGQVALLEARVTAAFRTSLEVLVQVDGHDAMTGARWPCVTAFVTFVAVQGGGDGDQKPKPVPPLELLSDEERRLAEAGAERRARRLARRQVRKDGA